MTGDQMSSRVEPQLNAYLHSLDIALAQLRHDDAVELRQQIVEHLNEALGPDADERHVTEVLHRLGRPEDLVSESLRGSARRRLSRFRTWGWRRWATVALAIAIVGSGAGFIVDMATQPELQGSCQPCGWYYAGDVAQGHNIDSLTGNETVTADRPGQMQGFVFTVQNPSSWPETLLGVETSTSKAIGALGPPRIAVSAVSPTDHDYRSVRYLKTPVVIPPGQYRFLRVSWRSAHCEIAIGGISGSDGLEVRVKTGWFTHVQDLQIQQTFALSGVAQPHCSW